MNKEEIAPEKEYLKQRGVKNPPIDSGIGGAVELERTYVSTVMREWANQQTATIQQELDRLKKPWVKCSERPYTDMGHRVLCLCSSGSKAVGYQLNGEWTRDSDGKTFERMGYIVTHWCELP